MNTPGTPEHVAFVKEQGERLSDALSKAPGITFTQQWNDSDEFPLYSWLGPHATLPFRALVIRWGIPEHKPGCTCIEPNPPVLQMEVIDPTSGTGEPDENTGSIELVNPSDMLVMGGMMMSVVCFLMNGNL